MSAHHEDPLLQVLRDVEWTTRDPDDRNSPLFCPRCGADKDDGHADYCALALALREHADVQHTAEPWLLREQGEANQFCLLADGGRTWVLGVIHNGEPLPAKQRANLKRIVGCVNGCAGLKDPAREVPALVVRDAARTALSGGLAVECQRLRAANADFAALVALAGHVEDGSAQSVTFYQDDATRWWCVRAGMRNGTGRTLGDAIADAGRRR